MSTLRVDEAALEQAVEPFASVAGLRIRADFPHDLRVEVVEHEPVASVRTGGERPAGDRRRAAARRRARGRPADRDHEGAAARPPRERRAHARGAAGRRRRAARAARVARERLVFGQGGLTLELNDGPDLIFGSGGDARTKWRAAARVLSEPSSGGATYLDLRVPTLVAAGGVGPIEPEPTPDPSALPSNPQP